MPRLRFLVLLLLLLGSLPALSLAQCPGMTTPQVPFSEEILTIDNTVKTFTPAVYQPAGVQPTMAMFTISGGAIHYSLVGPPTTTPGGVGHYLSGTPPQQAMICGLDSLKGFKAIREAATNAILQITYFRAKTP